MKADVKVDMRVRKEFKFEDVVPAERVLVEEELIDHGECINAISRRTRTFDFDNPTFGIDTKYVIILFENNVTMDGVPTKLYYKMPFTPENFPFGGKIIRSVLLAMFSGESCKGLAVVVHQGANVARGHWYTLARTKGGGWLELNDTEIKPTTFPKDMCKLESQEIHSKTSDTNRTKKILGVTILLAKRLTNKSNTRNKGMLLHFQLTQNIVLGECIEELPTADPTKPP